MRKHKEKLLLALFILLLLVSILLVICSSKNDVDDGGNTEIEGGSAEGENTPKKPLIWDFDTEVYFVSDITTSERHAISDKFIELTGNYLIPYSEGKTKQDHELVVGRSNRPVSVAAYDYLDRLFSTLTQYDDAEGYVIYALDGSLGVAYNGDSAYNYAVEAFYKNCLISEEYYADNGVVYWDYYSLDERAEQNREKMYAEGFDWLGSELVVRGVENADDIIAGLKKYYSLIKTEQLYWLAGLYDPEIGAFYHCNSGRDNLGYLPDLESTVQTFLMLDRGGLFKTIGRVESGEADLPASILEPLAEWVKGLQSSTDGFFYHPQWSSVGSARRGRDLDNAITLLRISGARPYYDDPSGRLKGTLGAPGPNAQKPAAALTVRLDDSVVRAVSAITPVASTLPSYLQSMTAWKKYVDGLNINSNNQSYYKGNNLASEWSLIKAAGPEYVEYVINYLNDHQIVETGLWEYQNEQDYDPNDKVGYNGTNGLMKICVFYSAVGYAVPNAYNALKSTIKVGLYPNTDPRDETVCYTFNIWTCLGSMMSNIKAHDPEHFDEAQALLAENIPALLESAYDLQHTHLLSDGGFNYYERKPINAAGGASTGCSKVPESDTDSTMVATSSTIGAIYSTLQVAFGSLTPVELWYVDDYYIFMRELLSAEKVQKN